jgi:hypothetical protein
MKITAGATATQFSLTQQSLEATVTPQIAAQSQRVSTGDRLDISDEARTHSRKGRAAHRLQEAHEDQGNRKLLEFLRDLVQALTGSDVKDLLTLPDMAEDAERSPYFYPGRQPSSMPALAAELQQTSVSIEQQSFAFNGTVKTADGQELAFSLELQYTHASFSSQSASFQSGPTGSSFSFAGTAAELTSTSFSFTLATTDQGAEPAQGVGRFNVNDELSAVGKILKPIVNEAFGEQGWDETSRMLRTIG